MCKIRSYETSDEEEWKKCHMVSYYHSSYFDELVQFKPRYETPTIELVAAINRQIIGILDIEIEKEPRQLCSDDTYRSGLISVIGVNPKHRRKGIGSGLISKSLELLKNNFKIKRLEIWIRYDQITLNWLNKNDFNIFDDYYQVTLSTDFFEKLNIHIPFEIYPVTFIGNIEEKSFRSLLDVHAPEKSYKIVGLEKFF